MTTATTKIGMPLNEFIQLYDSKGPFEIINGERIPIMPSVAGHNEVLDTLYMALRQHVESLNLGLVRIEATFILPDKYDSNWVEGSRTPDLMFIHVDRLTAYREAHPDWRQKPYLIVPDFVVEIVSPNDSFSKIDEKVDAYLLDGVRLIWVIDPQRRKAIVYTPDAEQSFHLRGDAVLDGEDVIPGFQIVLSKLFE
jgi:Uma2 family endonuclease